MKKIVSAFFIIILLLIGCDDITSPQIPNVPFNLNIEVLDVSHINLSWQYNGGVVGDTIKFAISQKVGEYNWNDYHGTVYDGRSFADQISTTDTLLYAYKIRATNLSSNTEYPFSNTIAYFSEESNPTNLELNQVAQDSILISWDDNCTGEEGYYLEKKINDGSWISPYVKLGNNVEHFLDKVNAFEIINYRLVAYFGESESETLEENITTTLGAPSNLSLTKPDINKVQLDWQDNSIGESGFKIDRKLGDLPWELEIATIDSNTTSWINDIDLPAATLQYRVSSFIDDISSSYCLPQTVNIRLNLVGFYNTIGDARDIEVNNLVAYVADNYNGLEIIDCSNTDNPTSQLNISIPDRTLSASLSENFLYVASNTGESPGVFSKIDLISSTEPVLTGFTNIHGIPNGIAVSGDHAYIASGEMGLTTVYITSQNPVVITNTSTSGFARNIAIRNHYAYVTNGLNGLTILDILNPANPNVLSNIPASGLANNVAISNNYAFITNGEDGLDIIDISDQSNPILLNNYQTNGFVYDVVVQNDYAYLIDKFLGIIILDISDINNIYQMGIYAMDTEPIAVYNFGSYLFVADNEGMKIIQVRS